MARVAATKPPAVDGTEVEPESTPAAPAPAPAEATEATPSLGVKDEPATKQSKVAASKPSAAITTMAKQVIKEGLSMVDTKPVILSTSTAATEEEPAPYASGLSTSAAPEPIKGSKGATEEEKKRAHSEVERKRRNKINTKIEELRKHVPEYINTKAKTQKNHKPRQASILENALSYIKDLESSIDKFDSTMKKKIHDKATAHQESHVATVAADVPILPASTTTTTTTTTELPGVTAAKSTE